MDPEAQTPHALNLLERLSSVKEVKQRGYALAERLADLEADEIITIIKTIREKAVFGHPNFIELYNALLFTSGLAEVLGREKMSELVDLAQQHHELEIVSLLMDIPPARAAGVHAQPFLDRELSELPLGIRKAMARKLDFKLIRRIARDQDHRVIRNLLDNPGLTEMDVTRIASTRPTSPKVLEEIYKHPRWITRYSTKRVVVLNPYTPTSIALRLMPFLSIQDLREIVDTPDLSSLLIKEARRIIEKKSQYLSEKPGP